MTEEALVAKELGPHAMCVCMCDVGLDLRSSFIPSKYLRTNSWADMGK